MSGRPSLSDNQQRAMRLLTGGAVGGHAGALLVTVGFFVGRGISSGMSCLIACAVALLFYIVGQAVQVIVADAPPSTVLAASLASYVIRVSALAGLLALSFTVADKVSGLDSAAVVAGMLTVVGTWLVAEIWTFSRLRIPVFDAPSANVERVVRGDDASC